MHECIHTVDNIACFSLPKIVGCREKINARGHTHTISRQFENTANSKKHHQKTIEYRHAQWGRSQFLSKNFKIRKVDTKYGLQNSSFALM